MSEYWVSNKKYYCTYCKIYIADDAPSRKQHETGLRHQGNKERFVRGLYKTSEKRKHDLDEEKREMVRIDQAAQAAFAQDVGSGFVKPGSSSQSTTSSTPPQKPTSAKPSKPSNPWTNYTTAASLGYTDPDEERIKAEMERRRTQGVVGEWEVVEQPTSTERKDELEPESSKKREAEGPPDSQDTRDFKLRKRVAPSVMDEWDADLIPIKLKPKKMEEGPELAEVKGESQHNEGAPIKWTSRGWKKPEDEQEGTTDSPPTKSKEEEENIVVPEPVATVSEPEVKEELGTTPVKLDPPVETVSEAGAVFRKRKLGGNRGRR